MWVIEILNCEDGSVRSSVVIVGPRCTVGRSKGDITFPTDRTVSRHHGMFVLRPAKDGSTNPVLSLIDCGSSSGILIGRKRISPNDEHFLEHGSVVSFGIHKESTSKVRVQLQRLHLCATRLDRPDREQLKIDCVALAKMGIRAVTAKLLGAIVYQKPIVTSAWLHSLQLKVESMRSCTAEGNPHVLPLPLATEEFVTPGMDLFRVVSRDKARNDLLKGVMVVLFVPTNDIYHSVLTGSGAIVVKMYGADSLGSSNYGTFPQAAGSSADISQCPTGTNTVPDHSLFSMSTQALAQSGDLSMLDGASQQNDSNDGSNRSSLSLLHQKIRRHMKEAASVKSDASNAPQLSCCLFLENQRDVNKEMLSLARTNRIGFLEPSGLASGVFSNTPPAITTWDDLRNKIATKSSAALLPPPPDRVAPASIAQASSVTKSPSRASSKDSDTSVASAAIAGGNGSWPGVSSAVSSVSRVSPIPAESAPPTSPPMKRSPVPTEKVGSTSAGDTTSCPGAAFATKSQKKTPTNAPSDPVGDLITSDWGIDEPAQSTSTSSSRRTRTSALDLKPISNVESESSFTSRAVTNAANRETRSNDKHTTSAFFPIDNKTEEHMITGMDMDVEANSSKRSSSNRTISAKTPCSSKKAKSVSLQLDAVSSPPPSDAEGWICGSAQHRGLTANALQKSIDILKEKENSKAVTSPVRTMNLAANNTEVEYDMSGSPVVVERQLDLKPHIVNGAANNSVPSSDAVGSGLRNVKRFRKNKVRGVFEPLDGSLESRFQIRARDVGLSVKHMDRVLPKESERELQLRLEVESFQQREQEQDEMMFAERFGGRSFKKLKAR